MFSYWQSMGAGALIAVVYLGLMIFLVRRWSR